MLWFWLSAGSAFCLATSDYFVKRYYQDAPLAEVVLARYLGVLPVCLPLIIWAPFPSVPAEFWAWVGAAIPLECLAGFLYIRGLQASPLTLSLPFLAFTPLVASVSGYFIMGEFPSWAGFMGILLLVAGAYCLNLNRIKEGWAMPFKAVFTEPGSWMMLSVGTIYAFTSVIGRKAIMLTDTLFFLSVYPLMVSAAMLLLLAASGRLSFSWLKRPVPVTLISASICGMVILHFFAIALVQVAYMISVKRLSLIFGMIYGGILLGEERLGPRLGAAGLMVLGAGVILVLG